MLTQFSRTELLLGKEAMDRLANAKVAVFGIGGVGGYVCEALVRSGVGAFDLIDDDKVCLTNLNRQIIATRKTIGKYKTDVMKERILEINPKAEVTMHKCFFLPENAEEFPFEEYDYVVDAVDTVTAKIELVMKCKEKNVPIISSMGAGNKLDASAFRVADIYKTKVCPLAKVMRRELKKRGVKKLKVVYSEEQPTRPLEDMSISCRTNCICPPGAKHKCTERRDIPGSVAFVPSVAGLIIAAVILLVVVLVLILNGAERRIPVQYSKKMVGRKLMGGQSTNIPLKVNTAGVIPVIFASSIMSFPAVIAQLTGKGNGTGIGSEIIRGLSSNNWCNPKQLQYTWGLVLYIVLCVFFAYFYTSITFNPLEVADNIKKQGGFIPGIRPGKPTSDYLTNILNYIIFIGAVGLIIVCVIPFIFNGVFGANVSFGGTSIIIIVGVILETVKQIESQLLVRNYKGFLNN